MSNYENVSIFAPLPVTSRATVFHLRTDPKHEKLIYCSGMAVVVRDLQNPTQCYMYNEHSKNPTAAVFSPSGYYCCSGDIYGKVRVWDTTQETHILKYEGNMLGGPIRDIEWSADSKRILVVGEGKKSSHCFMWDSGTSCGNISGHNGAVNAVAHSPERPYRAVTAGEDYSLQFFNGVPYKHNRSLKDHTNFVNCVRYSPKGGTFASVGSDKKIFVYDGKTGDMVGELKDGETGHSGGILSVSYSPDGDKIMTASADKTVKFWDLEAQKLISTYNAGNDLSNQQLGCLWAGQFTLSVSLSGSISYIDMNSNQCSRILNGHQKSIETLVVKDDKIITSSYDGRITKWDAESGDATYFTGNGHKSKIEDCRILNDDVITVDNAENKLLRTSFTSGEMGGNSTSLPCAVNYFNVNESTGLEVYSGKECQEILIFKNKTQVGSVKTKYQPSGVAIAPSGTVVAVGDERNPAIYIYDVEGDTLVQRQVIQASKCPTEMAFSPDGAWLASGSDNRDLQLFDVNNSYKRVSTAWSASSRVTTCDFNPSSSLVGFGSLDSTVYVCDIAKPMDLPIKILRAHPQAPISKVRWRNDNIIVSTGNDSQVRQFKV